MPSALGSVENGVGSGNDRALSSVSKVELLQHIAAIRSKRGHGDTRMQKAMKALYAYAIDRADVVTTNPTAGMKLTRQNPRDQYLDADERKRFLAALDAPGELPHIKPFFLLLLLTGARRNNLETAEWSEFDLEARKWKIPASKYKTNKAKEFPLREDAVSILKAWKKRKGAHAKWVFESPVYSRPSSRRYVAAVPSRGEGCGVRV